MKKTVLAIAILVSMGMVYADTPYIPEHLTNRNYDYSKQKVDCNSSANFGFIPTTIPDECKNPEEVKPVEKPVTPQPNSKLNRLLNTLL